MSLLRYQAIVVLGVSLNRELFAERVTYAVTLMNRRVAPALICSGRWWGGFTHEYMKGESATEAELMAGHARELGVSPAHIHIENRSLNTFGNFYFLRLLCDEKGFKQLLVLTHRSHMEKCRFLASKFFGPEYTVDLRGVGDFKVPGHSGVDYVEGLFKDIDDGDLPNLKRVIAGHRYYIPYLAREPTYLDHYFSQR